MSKQQWRDRQRAEKVVGRPLKTTEDVHHHTDGTLVICEDESYHKLLHIRTAALAACGHANWRKCCRCNEYDSPENLQTEKSASAGFQGRMHHSKCAALHTYLQRTGLSCIFKV